MLPKSSSRGFTPIFSPRNFVLVRLQCCSLTHFEFIVLHGKNRNSILVFCTWIFSFYNIIYQSHCCFPHWILVSLLNFSFQCMLGLTSGLSMKLYWFICSHATKIWHVMSLISLYSLKTTRVLPQTFFSHFGLVIRHLLQHIQDYVSGISTSGKNNIGIFTETILFYFTMSISFYHISL